MDVAVDRFRHRVGEVDVGVAGVGEQVGRLAQPPQQPIQQGEALGIAVEDQLAREIDEGARDVEGRLVDGRWRRLAEFVGGEEVGAALFAHAPHELVGRDRGESGGARGRAPAVEVGLGGKGDAFHANSSSCFTGASVALRSTASVIPPGCQPAQVMNGMTLFTEWQSRARSSRRSARQRRELRILADRLGAEARHPQQVLAVGRVDVDGEPVAVGQGPGGLGVDREVEHAADVGAGDLLHPEAVEAQQPVGLVEPVLAHQRRLDQRQDAAGVGDRAEGGIVHARQLVGASRARNWCAGSWRRRRRPRR